MNYNSNIENDKHIVDQNNDENNHNVFQLYDKIPVEQNDYHNTLAGNINGTLLSNLFFSTENYKILQNGLRKGVYDKSKGAYIIPEQKQEVLRIIMNSIFIEHSNNRHDNIEGQIVMLNNLVIDFAVPQLFSEAQSYFKYRRDIDSLPTPMAPPVMSKTTKQLSHKFW